MRHQFFIVIFATEFIYIINFKDIFMRKILLFLLALGSASTLLADHEVQVVGGGKAQNYAVDELSRIEFVSDGVNVIASDEMGETYLFVDNLEKILFHPLPNTGIEPVIESKMTLFVSRDGSLVRVNGWNGEKSPVTIYGISGQRMLHLREWRGGDIDVSGLASGVYIIQVGKKSAKFIK